MSDRPKVYVLRGGGMLVRLGAHEAIVHEPMIADGCDVIDAMHSLRERADALDTAAQLLEQEQHREKVGPTS